MGLHMNRKKDKPPVLVVEGDAGIAMAAELRNEIMGAMGESDTLTVDLNKVDNLDISCIQLLCAANRSFEKQSKTLKVARGGSSELCRTLLSGSGYDPQTGCAEKKCRTCLWKGKE